MDVGTVIKTPISELNILRTLLTGTKAYIESQLKYIPVCWRIQQINQNK